MKNDRSELLENLSCAQIVDCSQAGSKNLAKYKKIVKGKVVIYYYCYKCNKPIKPTKKPTEARQSVSTAEVLAIHPKTQKHADEPVLSLEGIPDRNLTEEVCTKYGCYVDKKGSHWYKYGENVWKVRDKNKNFRWIDGGGEKDVLFGQSKFTPQSSKVLLITEGEIDAMSAYAMGIHACVSLRDGASSAVRSIKDAWEYINSFESVCLCFDNDPTGIKAQKQAAELLGSKVKMMNLREPFKDANEYLMNRAFKHFKEDFWSSSVYFPDGIISGVSLKDIVFEPLPKPIAHYGWSLDNMSPIFGQTLVTVCAGSGLGKSAFLKQIIYRLLKTTDYSLGLIFLEEAPKKTMLGLMSLSSNKNLCLADAEATDEEKKLAYEDLQPERLYFYDSFGSNEIDTIVSKVRYLAKACDCKVVFLDHVSIIVSDGSNGDERKSIDEICTKLRTLIQETGITLFMVSHLARPTSGKGHELGEQVQLSQLRGSHSIAQLSDLCIALSRNCMADDEVEKNTTVVRVLKNRYNGYTGKACSLYYNKETTKMEEVFEEDLEEAK